MHKVFHAIYAFALKRKLLAAFIAVSFLAICSFLASRVQFQENITKLIPAGENSDITTKVLSQVKFADKITLLISKTGGTEEDLAEFAGELVDSLGKYDRFIAEIQGAVAEESIGQTYEMVSTHLPLYLDEQDYENIAGRLTRDSISGAINSVYRSIVSPAGMISKEYLLNDPLGINFMGLKKLQQLSIGENFAFSNGYVMTEDRNHLLLFLSPKLQANETDRNSEFIEGIDNITASLNKKFKGKAELSYYGATPISVANATQIKSDVKLTSLFAVVSLILLLAYFYRSARIPFLIFIPSIFGYAFAVAALYLIKGSVSVIALGISSILLGETTDYSIYVLTHIRNNRNVKLLFKDISKPLMLCGVTTSVTFLCLLLVRSEALNDLAIFASLSVIATTIFSLILIPLLYRPSSGEDMAERVNVIDKLASYPYHKNRILAGSVVIICLLSVFTYSKVSFDTDLSAMNFVPSNLKQTGEKLEQIADGESKSIYLVTHGADFNEVLQSNTDLAQTLEKLKGNTAVVNYSSAGNVVLSTQEQELRIARWNQFWTPERREFVKEAIAAEAVKTGFKANTFDGFQQMLERGYVPVAPEKLMNAGVLPIDEFITSKDGFYTISTLVKVDPVLRDSFVNHLKHSDEVVVIDRKETNEAFLGTLKDSFRNLVIFSFIAVVLILLTSFRRIELVLVSVVPIALSWLFTLGMMGMLGIGFNIINIIVVTLIFGIGVDYSIFMTSALQKEHTFGRLELPTYRASILLSVATTVLGIGVLIFAKHPALQSISVIALLGIFAVVIVTFVIQPRVFNFIVTNRVRSGRPPYEIRKFLHSSLSFSYYGLGGFLLSIFSVVMMKILPISRKSKTKAFHFLTSKFMHSVLVSYPAAKRKIVNDHNEKFEKPGVIIANHTSFLDILAVGMLSPKIIFLVSDWVYNSPVFGKGVRLAGFYPVSNGIDNGVEHLREKVAQGFSLMVFPEGTRSEDHIIKRFHKGAFFLAEQLNLDVIPVLVHGYSEVLPKGDFIINGGKTTVEILPRISPSDLSFGTDVALRTKSISSYFKARHRELRLKNEDPDFFRRRLINSYAYKEPEIIAAVSSDFQKMKTTYHQLWQEVPAKGKILHLADDYGQIDIMLVLQEPQRKIISVIPDDEQRAVANSNYLLKNRDITYRDSFPESLEGVSCAIISAKLEHIPIDFYGFERIILIGDPPITNTFTSDFRSNRISDNLTILTPIR